jgi:homoaconitase/3-isopropylmalate dehydratase large subunit
MIAPDDTTFEYLKGKPRAPQGADWDAAVARWRGSAPIPGRFDASVDIDAAARAHDHLRHQSRHGGADRRIDSRQRRR